MAEEDGLNSLFHKFISNYQKVYQQDSDNGSQDNDDKGIVFTDKLLSFVIVIEIVICIVWEKFFFPIRFMWMSYTVITWWKEFSTVHWLVLSWWLTRKVMITVERVLAMKDKTY